MKNRILSSFCFMFLGSMIILFPLYILPVCPLPEVASVPADTMASEAANAGHMHSSGGKIMKCFWTAKAELGVGALVMAIGFLMLFSRTVFIRMGLSMALACIAILAGAIPTVLIGVCGNEMMRCNIGAKPALVLLSLVLLIVAIINIVSLNKMTKRNWM